MSDSSYHELFPLGADDAPYRKLTSDHVSVGDFEGRRIVKVMPEALTLLAAQAFADSAHLLRPGHLASLRRDPRRSGSVVERQVRRLRSAEKRQHRRRPRVADVPGHRHRHRHGQKRASKSGPRATTPRRSRPAFAAPIPRPICAIARWRLCRCTRRSTPATTCRPRSTSTPNPATPTNSCSSPKAAARPTRAFSISRQRRC